MNGNANLLAAFTRRELHQIRAAILTMSAAGIEPADMLKYVGKLLNKDPSSESAAGESNRCLCGSVLSYCSTEKIHFCKQCHWSPEL